MKGWDLSRLEISVGPCLFHGWFKCSGDLPWALTLSDALGVENTSLPSVIRDDCWELVGSYFSWSVSLSWEITESFIWIDVWFVLLSIHALSGKRTGPAKIIWFWTGLLWIWTMLETLWCDPFGSIILLPLWVSQHLCIQRIGFIYTWLLYLLQHPLGFIIIITKPEWLLVDLIPPIPHTFYLNLLHILSS